MPSKKEKLSKYYTMEEISPAEYLSAVMAEVPLLKAMGDGVDELEMTKNEFVSVMRYALAEKLYERKLCTDGMLHITILGMIITVI